MRSISSTSVGRAARAWASGSNVGWQRPPAIRHNCHKLETFVHRIAQLSASRSRYSVARCLGLVVQAQGAKAQPAGRRLRRRHIERGKNAAPRAKWRPVMRCTSVLSRACKRQWQGRWWPDTGLAARQSSTARLGSRASHPPWRPRRSHPGENSAAHPRQRQVLLHPPQRRARKPVRCRR